MNYSSGVWGYKSYQCTDNVQHRAMRSFLGVHRFASIPAMYGDMAWMTPKDTRKLDMIRLWNRLVSFDDDRLTKKIFLEDHANGKHGWCSDVKKLFSELDSVSHFDDKRQIDINTVRQKLLSNQQSMWTDAIHAQDKLRTYITFKTVFKPENYLYCTITRSERSLIAQLRFGILPLHIETGRFHKLKADERYCTICNNGSVETEHHFIYDCSKYNEQRQLFVTDIGLDKPPPPLTDIFNNKRSIKLFAKYISNIFMLRKKVLYQDS